MGKSRCHNHTSPTQSIPTPTAPSSLPTTSASTTSVYTPLPPSAVPLINNSCPSTILFSSKNDKYDCTEQIDLNGGDIISIIAYTLQDCIDACSQYSAIQGNNACQGVILNKKMSYQPRGNCWLKGKLDGTVMMENRNMTAARLLDV
jgi:hypothetical protein